MSLFLFKCQLAVKDPPESGKGSGEISPKGSISWSDFDVIKKVTTELKLRD
jgi:hypothetical protein